MKSRCLPILLCASGALVVLSPTIVSAQLAPIGAHHAGRGPDSGGGGGYSTAVELDFPSARGGLPVPVSVVHGGMRVGAAGRGWDVPISMIRENRSMAGRRPTVAAGAEPVAPLEVTLSLFGSSVVLMQQGDDWVPQQAPAGLVARQQGTEWKVYDGNGQTYTFTNKLSDLFLLTRIDGTGGARVELTYEILTQSVSSNPAVSGRSIDLTRVDYNFSAAGIPKHRINLIYGAEQSKPLSMNVSAFGNDPLDAVTIVRKRVLQSIQVRATDDAGAAVQVLSEYQLHYVPDPDTELDQLQSVTMTGRTGTPEEHTPLLLARYEYGTATKSIAQSGGPVKVLNYEKVASVALPAGASTTELSSSERFSQSFPGTEAFALPKLFGDVNGDGLADLVFPSATGLTVARQRAASDGSPVFTDPALTGPLTDSVMSKTSLGSFTSNKLPHVYKDYQTESRTDTWSQFVDVNGDGRSDLIVADELDAYRWVIYLNTPDPGFPQKTVWQRRVYDVNHLATLLTAPGRNHVLDGQHLPLMRQHTGQEFEVAQCWNYDFNAKKWNKIDPGSIVFDPSQPATNPCPYANDVFKWNGELTATEWQLLDVNGDSGLDLVLSSSAVATAIPADNTCLDFGSSPAQTCPAPQPGNPIRYNARPFSVHAAANAQMEVVYSTSVTGLIPQSAPVPVASAYRGIATWGRDYDQAQDCSTNPAMPGWPCTLGAVTVSRDQIETNVLRDVNGDGLMDRVSGRKAYLGTGRGFTQSYIDIPGGAIFSNDRKVKLVDTPNGQQYVEQENCPNEQAPPTTAEATTEYRDVTGDGIPDIVMVKPATSLTSDWPWPGKVRIGNGAGFGPLIDIKATTFFISGVANHCDGSKSRTTRGLYDIDGDGRVEMVSLNGDKLDIHQLMGSSGARGLSAGLLTAIENGHGARTEISYKSAKDDNTSLHQLPYPEVVISAVKTIQSTTHKSTEVRYAYGNARLTYDAMEGRFTSPGYRRTIAVTYPDPTTSVAEAAVATITDAIAPTVSALDVTASLRAHLLSGRVQDVTTLTSALMGDPWSMLKINVGNPGGGVQVLGQSHSDYDTRIAGDQPASPSDLACAENIDPYATTAIYLNTCLAHGFAFQNATQTWRGTTTPQGGSLNNVMTSGNVLAIDDFGRVTKSFVGNDSRLEGDDLCVETSYATPSSNTLPRVLSAVSERRVGACLHGQLSTVLASERYEYDNLAVGAVSNGLLTSHIVDRRDSQTGAVLDTTRSVELQYDSFGNPTQATTENNGKSRSVSTIYDPFGLVAIATVTTATDAAPLSTQVDHDPFTLQARSFTDANQTRYGTTYDGFGRPLNSTVTPPGGVEGVMSKTRYFGFEADSAGRSIEVKTFNNPVPPAQTGVALGHTSTVSLDDFGRSIMSLIDLGSDYADDMVVGAVVYDTAGRVAFAADPFPKPSQDPATAYGTSFYYNPDGTTACTVRGKGPQLLTQVTNDAAETYPTCYTYNYSNGTQVVGVKTADALLSTLPQAGVERQARMTATGQLLSRSTLQNNTRLEFSQFTHDRLGNLVGMMRYKTPQLSLPPDPTNTVQWSWTYDSKGQMLTLTEPNAVTRNNDYDAWGELVKTWTPAGTGTVATPAQQQIMQYDGLGRLRHSEEIANGAVVPDTVRDFVYDTGIHGPATNVLGRLAYAQSSTGTTHFSYDDFGRPAQTDFTVPGSTNVYIQKAAYDADGTLSSLGLQLPDAQMALEEVRYSYDSARRLRTAFSGTQQLYNATALDAFGRTLNVQIGQATGESTFAADGRRLLQEFKLADADGVRTSTFRSYDPLGREFERFESDDNASTIHSYDALGRLALELRTQPGEREPLSRKLFAYDALGNLLSQTATAGDASGNVAMTYRTDDLDQLCRVNYGTTTGTACNVVHDALGNIVQQATADGSRNLSYLPSGAVSSMSKPDGSLAKFRYNAFGGVQELDVKGPTNDVRHDRRYGGMIEVRDELVNGKASTIISRNFPLGGASASRRGADGPWVFALGEQRGNRYFLGGDGKLLQKVNYDAFGKPKNTGAQPGSPNYSREQWNGGDNLAAFGLSHLGARMYDPVLGRFLSRDPLVQTRTAVTSNPYSFANNDPVNLSDPSGLQPGEVEPTGGAVIPPGTVGSAGRRGPPPPPLQHFKPKATVNHPELDGMSHDSRLAYLSFQYGWGTGEYDAEYDRELSVMWDPALEEQMLGRPLRPDERSNRGIVLFGDDGSSKTSSALEESSKREAQRERNVWAGFGGSLDAPSRSRYVGPGIVFATNIGVINGTYAPKDAVLYRNSSTLKDHVEEKVQYQEGSIRLLVIDGHAGGGRQNIGKSNLVVGRAVVNGAVKYTFNKDVLLLRLFMQPGGGVLLGGCGVADGPENVEILRQFSVAMGLTVAGGVTTQYGSLHGPVVMCTPDGVCSMR